jgi:hypothetical protein
MASYASQQYEGIITCDDNNANILRRPTPFLEEKPIRFHKK